MVIDQELDMNGIKMRTLGLAPHLVAKNLHNLSDKLVESVAIDLKELSNPDNYVVEKDVEGYPKNYEELDRRSRFRIITTSPSLDTRIKSNSCVQIQHVNSEMYLSYERKQGSLDIQNAQDLAMTME